MMLMKNFHIHLYSVINTCVYVGLFKLNWLNSQLFLCKLFVNNFIVFFDLLKFITAFCNEV